MSENVSPSNGPHPQSAFGHPVAAAAMRSASDHGPSAVAQAGGTAPAPSEPSVQAPRNAENLSKVSVADTIAQRLSQQETQP